MSKKAVDFGVVSVCEYDDILVLKLDGGSKHESVFNPTLISQFHSALDYCEQLIR